MQDKQIKVMDLIPESLRPQLIKEVAELLKVAEEAEEKQKIRIDEIVTRLMKF